jgi:hypothetical protein
MVLKPSPHTMTDIPELLERFRRGAELIAAVTTGAAGPELDFSPAPGKWAVRQIVCHMADSEIVAVDRFRRTIAENNPTLIGYDEKAWAQNLDYSRRKFSQALETFRRMRGENYELLKALPAESFERTCTHSEHGNMTLYDLLKTYTSHAESHARQIREVRESYKESRNR